MLSWYERATKVFKEIEEMEGEHEFNYGAFSGGSIVGQRFAYMSHDITKEFLCDVRLPRPLFTPLSREWSKDRSDYIMMGKRCFPLYMVHRDMYLSKQFLRQLLPFSLLYQNMHQTDIDYLTNDYLDFAADLNEITWEKLRLNPAPPWMARKFNSLEEILKELDWDKEQLENKMFYYKRVIQFLRDQTIKWYECYAMHGFGTKGVFLDIHAKNCGIITHGERMVFSIFDPIADWHAHRL